MARCGFGDELVRAFEKKQDDQEFQRFLVGWRARVNLELQTNSRDMLSKALPRFSLPADFPDINVLQAYIKPIRSEGGDGGRPLRHKDTLSIPKLVAFCEAKFEDWGSSSAVLKRFLKLIQGPAIMQVLRGAALVADAQEKIRREALGIHDLVIREPLKPSRADSVETPPTLVKKFLSGGVAPSAADEYRDVFVNQGASQPRARAVAPDPHPLIEKIIGERRDISTGELLEYKVNICPSHLVTLAKQGIKWTRPDGPTASIDNSGLHSAVWMWIPASIFHQVHPGLVEDYTIMEEAKKNKKTRSKGKGKARETQYDSDDVDVPTKGVTPPPKTKRKYIKKAPPAPGQRADGNSSPSRVPQPSAVGRKRQVFSTAGDASHPQTESSVSSNTVHSSHPSDRDAGLQVRGHAPSGQNSIALALADALNDDIKVLTVPKQKQNKTRMCSSQPSLVKGGTKRKAPIVEIDTPPGAVAGPFIVSTTGPTKRPKLLHGQPPPTTPPTTVQKIDSGSDSEVEFVDDSMVNGRATRAYPLSSQDSRLSYMDTDVIDLTDLE